MTHLLRSDGDKMLADMAEGSADYGDNDPYDYNDGEDMSGSGDGGLSCKSMMHNDNKLIFDCSPLVHPTDGREVPIVEPGTPDDNSRIDLGGETTTAGCSYRISIAPTTLVLTSLIVIFVVL